MRDNTRKDIDEKRERKWREKKGNNTGEHAINKEQQ